MGFINKTMAVSAAVVAFLSSLGPALVHAGDSDLAQAELIHNCPYPVYCATVVGYHPDDLTPQEDRPGVAWHLTSPQQAITDSFHSHDVDTGVALMCTRDPTSVKPMVTQMEYTWRPDLGQTFFDLSNVEGNPFGKEGFAMTLWDPSTVMVGDCSGAYCAPGQEDCAEIYNKWNDDFQGMRACSDQVKIRLQLCTGAWDE
ncbi:hypothetical protein B0A52_05798 [Exophiala mesophila]|uniref:Ig-like domain-containing protein n=1 Tax=Exophiala mesophila TaxID=212818 RepID=A0A438N2P1_EXOME|nr:hypothetical protein B0A52_05798 [Exophiala mesophila]